MKDQNNKTQDQLEVTMPLEVAQAALAAMNKVFLDWDVLNDEAPKFLKRMQDLTYYVERAGGGGVKDLNDNKTVDCFSTRHAVKQGERLVIVLRGIIEKRGRTSVLEVKQWIGVSERATLTFIRQLMAEGYLESNSSKPLSLKATDKAKQLFGVQG